MVQEACHDSEILERVLRVLQGLDEGRRYSVSEVREGSAVGLETILRTNGGSLRLATI